MLTIGAIGDEAEATGVGAHRGIATLFVGLAMACCTGIGLIRCACNAKAQTITWFRFSVLTIDSSGDDAGAAGVGAGGTVRVVKVTTSQLLEKEIASPIVSMSSASVKVRISSWQIIPLPPEKTGSYQTWLPVDSKRIQHS
jgi:hypothetical protein